MNVFTQHTIETARTPEIREALSEMKKAYGFVPNLGAILAESPVALKALFSLYETNEGGTLTPAERQLVYLAASAANACSYCVAAHSMLGKKTGLDPEMVEAARSSRGLEHPKLEALREFTTRLVTDRGHVSNGDILRFLNSGYTKAQVFEVLSLIAAKIITNYANHIARTPLNEEFAQAGSDAVAQVSK